VLHYNFGLTPAMQAVTHAFVTSLSVTTARMAALLQEWSVSCQILYINFMHHKVLPSQPALFPALE
jgi:hypothetical protein